MAKKGTDKRIFERIPIQSIVFYRVEKDSGDQNVMDLMTSQTPLSVDLSEGGMKILGMQDIPKGTKLKIILTFYDSRFPINLEGRVAWSQTDEKGFLIGMQFIGITDTKKKIIRNHLQNNRDKTT